MFIWWYRWKN